MDFHGLVTISGSGTKGWLTHGLEQPDLLGGLFSLKLDHPGILDDIQDGGTLGGLAEHVEDQILGQRERGLG